MIRTRSWAIWLMAFLAVATLGVGAQSGLPTVSLESVILESFDENPSSRWIARGSKFTTIEWDQAGKPVRMFPVLADVAGFPQALFGRSKDNPSRGVLGLWGKFDRRAYNFIEIVPAREAESGTPDSAIVYQDLGSGKKWVHAPIDLKGTVHYLDLWVWGSNHNYYMEVHLEDYRGIDYTLNFGDLNYFGWKNLRIGIPGYIPQSTRYVPRFRSMRLTKLVLWTRPQEKVDEFFVYFDHLKAVTDLFESRYDGDDLEEPELMQQVWGRTWD